MNILVIEQVWAIVLFLLGVFALNTFSLLERKEQEFLKDPCNRYGKRKSDIVKPKSFRSCFMTLSATQRPLFGWCDSS